MCLHCVILSQQLFIYVLLILKTRQASKENHILNERVVPALS